MFSRPNPRAMNADVLVHMYADGRQLISMVPSWRSNPALFATVSEQKGNQWYETTFRFSAIVNSCS